jgi:hypothetical protein
MKAKSFTKYDFCSKTLSKQLVIYKEVKQLDISSDSFRRLLLLPVSTAVVRRTNHPGSTTKFTYCLGF